MATDRFFRVVQNGEHKRLAPVFEETEEWLEKQPLGKNFKANMKVTRNPGHHRKAFAMFNLIKENHPQYESTTDVMTEMKVRAGHYTEFIKSGNSEVAAELREWIRARLRDNKERDHMLALVDRLERIAKIVYMPKSISFDAMGQEEFEELYDAWIPIACQMMGVEDDELRRELAAF